MLLKMYINYLCPGCVVKLYKWGCFVSQTYCWYIIGSLQYN